MRRWRRWWRSSRGWWLVSSVGSRGVVPGDVSRADAVWNERVGAATGAVPEAPGELSQVPRAALSLMAADLFSEEETQEWASDLVHSYTTMHGGLMFDILMVLAAHALAVGVLTERQRWDGGAGKSLREARLEGALREIVARDDHADVTSIAAEALGGS
jgi:hypothetical protein